MRRFSDSKCHSRSYPLIATLFASVIGGIGTFGLWTIGVGPFSMVTAAAGDGDYWSSFESPARPQVPRVDDRRWNRNPIDAFIKRTLDEHQLEPARRADRRTLIRRAYLDLLGLLPQPHDVELFLADESPAAYTRLIDRLLASPHYGERWGRHWLDAARYADSGGYEFDYDYPNAWRFRDYVVRAYNSDKPYNRFVLEQLAGDELDDADFDSLIATGFNRVGPTVGYREKDNPQYRFEYLDDMIATTSQAFLGLTVQCARCHDHKFDPIEQRDYYRMMAVFFPYINFDFPLAAPDVVAEHESRKAKIDAQIEPLRSRIAEIERPAREASFEKKLVTLREDIQVAVRTPEEDRTPGQKLLAAQVLSLAKDPVSIRELLDPQDRQRIKSLEQQIKNLECELPAPLPVAMGIRDGDYRFAPDGPGDEALPGKGNREVYDFDGTFIPSEGESYVPPKTHFLPSGNYLDKADEVQPGFVGFLTGHRPFVPKTPDNGHVTSGRRRALAEWIVDQDHPLTARVMVNRIWQQHFGRGIVSTTNNFGSLGDPPSHPELLDWLAMEFIDQGWSVKRMHRMIMISETYRLASDHYVAGNAESDPFNYYLYRYPQRRLEAEAIRDNILVANGNLQRQIGGQPFFPRIPEKVRQSEYYGRWDLSDEGPELWRRSVYSYYRRGLRYPMFEVFDQPDPNFTCDNRDTSTVPTQALCLMNNSFVLRQAHDFAERIRREAGHGGESQVQLAYQIALSRPPSDEELELNVAFLSAQCDQHRRESADDPELKALVDLCHVILNLNEFVYVN